MARLLEGERIGLRGLEPEDLAFLYRIENNTKLWQVSSTLTPYSKFVLKQYLEQAHVDIYTAKQLRLIVALKDDVQTPFGAIDLFDFDPYHLRAGVGIVIEESHQQSGYAAEALGILIEYCFSHLKLHQLYCNITSDNTTSIKLFESKGFAPMGRKKDWTRTSGGWMDELQYQLISRVK